MPELEGRVALVTGAGRGLGRAHAMELARRGAAVVVNDVDGAPAAEVAAEIGAAGGCAVADSADIASIGAGGAAVERVIAGFGRIDVLVNNAGFASGCTSAADPDESELDALLDVHLKAALGTMAAALSDMRTRRWGRIVNTVSEAALDARFVEAVGYGAAKAALWSATLAAATQGAADGITVNAISPGARTRLNADLLDASFRDGASAGLDLSPEHVARVVAWLASDDAADVTGRIIHAAGGAVREYTTIRTRSDLAQRIEAAAAVGL